MTSPSSQPDQRPEPTSAPGPGDGRSVGLGVLVLLAISAAIVFWAGLSLGGQTSGRDDQERTAIEAFTQTYRRINDQYIGVADPDELVDAAICGMFETLDDPYSVCMPPGEYEARFEDVSGEFGGIGAVMNTEDSGGVDCAPIDGQCRLRVLEVLRDSPALEAGLQRDDRVIAVDGEPLDGLTITDSVLLIRGPRGSDVTLTLDRDSVKQDLVITRDTIVTEDVHVALFADDTVGYLGVDNFSANAAQDFEAELRGLLDTGVDRLVLDVRGDPGGFVDAAVDISSQFLADGAVFWEEDAEGQQHAVDVSGRGLATDPGVELVVLVDGGSASASEIVAGALQDAGRALLVGERTFGKGTVQEWTELPGARGGFRLSIAKWLTRDKTWIDGAGLKPDVEVVAGDERFRANDPDADAASDPQLQRAVSLLVGTPLPEAVVSSSPEPEAAAASSPAPVAAGTASPLPEASQAPSTSD